MNATPLPPPPAVPPLTPANAAGRCHWCGYSLIGLQPMGTCPECGKAFDPTSSSRLRPWPSALSICVRLGWPLIGLAGSVGLTAMAGSDDGGVLVVMGLAYVFLIALPINTYFQLRSMFKAHVPDQKRTTGPFWAFRAVGTVVCVLFALVVLAPAIALGACLIAISMDGGGF